MLKKLFVLLKSKVCVTLGVKPGEERKKRPTRRRENYETKKVDLSEIHEMERSHARRKTERRKRRLGLPSDEEQQPTINNNHQDLKALDEELKRRQEALERYFYSNTCIELYR